MKRAMLIAAALAATTAWAGCPASDSTGGNLECSTTNTRSECPGNSSMHRMTAIQTLKAVDESFKGQFPNAVWMGGIAGINIDRDGKVMDKGPLIDILGTQMENATGWTGNYCSDAAATLGDQLNFDTTKGNCTGLRTCQAYNCTAVQKYDFPKVDSDAAVKTAFPNDPAGTLYSILLVMQNGAYWSISREGAAAVKIDVNTGAIVP